MKKLFSLFLAAALVCAGLVGCSGSKEDKFDTIKANGELVVYTDPNFEPFEYVGEGGKYVGVDMDLAQAIADELGVKLVVNSADFDSIIMALAGGSGDIAISAMTINKDRKKNADFSKPYFSTVQYLIVPEGSQLKKMEDLKGKKVGVAVGYTGSTLIEKEINEGVLKGSGASFAEYPNAAEAVLDMKNGRVAAVVMDQYVAQAVVASTSGVTTFELKGGSVEDEDYGVVVPKKNPKLLEAVNKVIDRLTADGTIKEWVLKHTGE